MSEGGGGGGAGGGGGGGGASADSYIGSVISLTSKSDIRYEGVLYTVDTAESNMALQNVRSFGTEGRKKDGPQIPLSDKVYDFIIFRGSDIKDLQVKMSPPLRATQPQHLHPDPAIISLQPSAMGAPSVVGSSTSSANTSPPGTNATAISTDMTSYASIPSVFRSSVPPLYQPQVSWATPQVPQANMYWTGYYRPPVGIPFIQPQAQLQFPALPSMPLSYASLSRYLQPLKPTMATSVFPPTSSSSSMVQEKAADLPLNRTDTMTRTLSGGVSVAQESTSLASAMETNVQRNTVVEASISKTSTGDESLNVVTTGTRPVSSSAADSASTSQEVKEPLLPLPANSNQRKATQVYGSTAYAWRGKGRCGSMLMFSEDFDFTAMNEKFNKHEVWGQLGRTRSSDKGDGEEDASNLHLHDAEEDSYRTPVYVKDDFFDTLSSDSGGQNEKMKYSEQRKVDSETFGSESVRSHGGRSIGYRRRGAGYRGRGYYGNRGDGNRSRGRNYARSPSFYY